MTEFDAEIRTLWTEYGWQYFGFAILGYAKYKQPKPVMLYRRAIHFRIGPLSIEFGWNWY